MNISYTKTPWIKPFSESYIYKIRYFIARYEGNMKNGNKVRTNVYEPIIISKEEMKDTNIKQLKKMVSFKNKLAKKAFANRINNYLSGNKRIGMPGYKGYFYFINAEEIT